MPSQATSPSPRLKRVLCIVLIGVLFVVLLVDEGHSLSSHPSSTATPWIWFATYALIALLFLGIGSLVWLYGYSRQRAVATLLFIFCSLMTFAFGTLSSSSADSVLNTIGSVSSALAVLVLLFVLVLFPVNLLTSRKVHPRAFWALLSVLITISGLCLLATIRCISVYLFHSQVPPLWTFLGLMFYGIAGNQHYLHQYHFRSCCVICTCQTTNAALSRGNVAFIYSHSSLDGCSFSTHDTYSLQWISEHGFSGDLSFDFRI